MLSALRQRSVACSVCELLSTSSVQSGYRDAERVWRQARTLNALPDLGNVLTLAKQGQSGPAGDDDGHRDVVVIGGGSGGLAFAREAARLNARVALFNHVPPSPHGTVWGLGGTCLNVGCIPKKLMHAAALQKDAFGDAIESGWRLPDPAGVQHDWAKLVRNVSRYVQGTSWKYRRLLQDAPVQHIDAPARFCARNAVEWQPSSGAGPRRMTADHFVIAVGSRPLYLDVPGADLCISSDDMFTLSRPPGRVLIVGGGYIAVETAGLLHGLGYPVDMVVRSRVLRGFDEQMGGMVAADLQRRGVRIVTGTVPSGFVKRDSSNEGPVVAYGTDGSIFGEYDTVVLATGRRGNASTLNLNAANVQFNESTGKVNVDDMDVSSNPNVYAIGDVANGRPELAPTAIQAGRLLARRLFSGSKKTMDYTMVPTTVFSPIEYSSVGLSEEQCVAQLGKAGFELYHTYINPLEWAINQRDGPHGPERPSNVCYAKVLVTRDETEKVLGIHFLGPDAGEVMQGFAVAFKVGITKADLDDCVGIHPTRAEELVTLEITKSSGASPLREGC